MLLYTRVEAQLLLIVTTVKILRVRNYTCSVNPLVMKQNTTHAEPGSWLEPAPLRWFPIRPERRWG